MRLKCSGPSGYSPARLIPQKLKHLSDHYVSSRSWLCYHDNLVLLHPLGHHRHRLNVSGLGDTPSAARLLTRPIRDIPCSVAWPCATPLSCPVRTRTSYQVSVLPNSAGGCSAPAHLVVVCPSSVSDRPLTKPPAVGLNPSGSTAGL